MNKNSRNHRTYYNKREQKNPSQFDNRPQEPSPFMEPEPSSFMHPSSYFQSANRNYPAENFDFKTSILSLENTMRQFGDEFRRFSHTLEGKKIKTEAEKKTKKKASDPNSLQTNGEPLNQAKLDKPMKSKISSPSPLNPSTAQTFPASTDIPKLPVQSKCSKRNKIKSNPTSDSDGIGKKTSVKSLVSESKNLDVPNKANTVVNTKGKGQQNPTSLGQNQQNPTQKPLCKKAHSESLNNFAVGKKSDPKVQPKKLKKNNSGNNKKNLWNLLVIIKKDISVTPELTNYLKERLKNKIQFEVKSVTKDKISGYIQFLLEFKSKRQYNLAIGLFNTSNKNNSIQIDCKRIARDSLLSESTPENKPDSVLQQHEKKIESIRQEIITLMRFEGGNFSFQEANAISLKTFEHKERELLLMLIEYKKNKNYLEMQLKQLQKAKKEYTVEKDQIFKKLNLEQNFLSRALPLYAMRTKIIETVLKNKVTILKGNCGSGKSTQLVQYLMGTSLIDTGMIACTEPSEKQALTMAKFVTTEVDSVLGNLIGYSSGNDIHLSVFTNILFMSEHELLEQFEKMKSFSAYSCVIIDEAQEMTINVELLLGLLKLELCKNTNLRVIIITSQAETNIFHSFFADSVLLEVNTCLFPVQVVWDKLDTEDHSQLLKKYPVEKALAVHSTEDEGDILVFVASVAEALECCKDFKSHMTEENYVCLPLHSQQDYDQLKGIYRPLPPGKRKIIFATQFAEVMNTVPNVRYVIDTGLQKERFLESGNKNQLPISFITQESAQWRKEKAGGCFKGKCYRLYSLSNLKAMEVMRHVEMSLDGSIENAVLYLIKQDIDPIKFVFPTNIPEKRVFYAIKNLESLEAILPENGNYKLTKLGTRMSQLPFRPQINWMLLEGIKQGMVMESVALASLSNLKQEVFLVESRYNKMMQEKYHQFGQSIDSIALRTLRVLNAWFLQPNKKKNTWCTENFLALNQLTLIISKMKNLCKTLETKLEMNIKFSPILSIHDTDKLMMLIGEAMTKFSLKEETS